MQNCTRVCSYESEIERSLRTANDRKQIQSTYTRRTEEKGRGVQPQRENICYKL